MTARVPITLLLAIVLAGCGREEVQQEGQQVDDADLPELVDPRGTTPMAEREAVLGLLNKRNGIVQDLTLKPGQSVRVGDVIVRLRACETTAPWEREKLTGAFIQVDVQRPDEKWDRVFSGWVYKESPSLNVVEHPVYDVWPKSCAMSWPEVGALPSESASDSSRSSASNSGGGSDEGAADPSSGQDSPSAEPGEADGSAEPSADDNNEA